MVLSSKSPRKHKFKCSFKELLNSFCNCWEREPVLSTLSLFQFFKWTLSFFILWKLLAISILSQNNVEKTITSEKSLSITSERLEVTTWSFSAFTKTWRKCFLQKNCLLRVEPDFTWNNFLNRWLVDKILFIIFIWLQKRSRF